VGKRRKIHNFPLEVAAAKSVPTDRENWRRRLSALVAATNRTEADLLDEGLQLLAMKILKDSSKPEIPG
jgi:hypothetical protein